MDEIVYTMRDWQGFPTSVPKSKLDAWLAQQAELEKNPPPVEPPIKFTEETWEQLRRISTTRLDDSGQLPPEHAK